MIIIMALMGAHSHLEAGYDPNHGSIKTSDQLPTELEGIKIEQKIGSKIDPSLKFIDDAGKAVTIGDFLKRGKPLILSLVYYSCPSLCNLHLNGITDVMKEMSWTAGDQFEALSVSFDPKENSDMAAQKKANHIKELGRPEAASGWHFLTGDQANTTALASQVGFGYRWDESSQQWAHGSAAIIVSPNGTITRYIHGVVFDSQTMKLALVDAGEGKVGSIVDNFMMYCFKFDPGQNKYVFYAFNIMRAGAGLVAVILLGFLIQFWLSTRRRFKEGYREISSSI